MNSSREKENITIEITTGTIVRAILLGLLLVFLYMVRHVIAILLFSVVIASAIEPIAHFAGRYRIPRILTVIATYFLTFGFLSFSFYLIVPALLSEFLNFTNNFSSQWVVGGETGIGTIFGLTPNLPGALSQFLIHLFAGLEVPIKEFTSGFFQTTVSVFGGVFSLVLTIIISFYLSVQEHGIEKFLLIITPRKYEEYILDLWMRSQIKLGRWIQGQVLLGVLVGVLVFLGLMILEVKYALILAMLAAIFELIPNFGPVLASIPAIGIAFLQSPSLALAVIILFIIIQQFENHLIQPVVIRKIIGVPPILSILAMIIGGTLAGLWGILLAVPVAAVLIEILDDMAAKKQPSV